MPTRNKWCTCSITYVSEDIRFVILLRVYVNSIITYHISRDEGKAEPSKLSDDDLIQILNQAKPEEWQLVILGANIELYKFNFKGTVD
jgi:hypothetical protein